MQRESKTNSDMCNDWCSCSEFECIPGSKTIHSWSGIGLGKGKHTEIIEKKLQQINISVNFGVVHRHFGS